jgi:hypothetical protein
MFRNHQRASFSFKKSVVRTHESCSRSRKTPIVWVPRSDETAQGFKIAASHARYFRIHPSSTRARADKDEKNHQRISTPRYRRRSFGDARKHAPR